MPHYEDLDPFQALERVNQAAQYAETSEQLLERVLDVMLEVFQCDRAWLLYPCSPTAPSYHVPMERTVPKWPGAASRGDIISQSEASRVIFEACLASADPVRYDPECNPIAPDHPMLSIYKVRSMLVTAIHPLGDQPWALGIHHCTQARTYERVVPLLRAIGRRMAEALTSHLATRRLRESEARFRALVEHAPEAIVLMDAETYRFVDANPNAERLFGRPRHELLMLDPLAVSPPHQPDGRPSTEGVRKWTDLALAGEFPCFEWLHQAPDGTLLPCEVRLAMLPHGSWMRASVTLITDRKAAEREREELQHQLAQSQKMEAIGQLTGGMAHDFNNLLTVIAGALDLLLDSPGEKSQVVENATLIKEAADRAQALTHRLLAFARRQALRPTALDVGALLRSMDELLRRTLGEHVDLELVVGGGLWKCAADAAQLESAVLNLAINARDAMPRGGRLTLEASNARLDHEYAAQHQEVIPGQYVLLAVSDSGTGIAPDVLNQIFTPFFTTKPVGVGSGLGLSMVFGFVKQSGGHIKVYSELGRGTTMKLYLPRADEWLLQEQARKAQGGDQAGGGQRILVVDDDEALRGLVAKQLSRLGYHPVAVGTGREALALLQRGDIFDLLLTDVVLAAGETGAELAREAIALLPKLRVLYMSGYTENSIVHNGRVDRGVELLEKPFDRATLAARLHAVLDD